MAVDMFFKIGDINGESADDKHKGDIDVLSWSWGANQTGTTHTGTGAGAGKVNVHDLTFTKHIDRATPRLLSMCCGGTHIPKSVLVVRKAGGKPLEYLKITLNDAIVSSIQTGGSGGDDRLTETIGLNFGAFTLEYVPQKADGSGEASIKAGWNIAANKEI